MTPNLLTIWITAVGCGMFVLVLVLGRRWLNQAAEDPRVILRRCKVELLSIRQELSHLPGSRETMATVDEIDRTLSTIEQKEWQLK